MTIKENYSSVFSELIGSDLLFREKALSALKVLYLTRFMDAKMGKLVRQNKGTTLHLSARGHELIGAVAALSLSPGIDWAFPYYRDKAFALGLGCSPFDLFASFLARDIKNHSGGRMMPEHFSQVNLRIPCQSSCVGSQFLQAAGVAKSALLRQTTEVVYVSGGDGATSQGDFHETLNIASLLALPLIVVIQDNGWAISVPIAEQTAGHTIAKMARGYEGLLVLEIDGCDFFETTEALKKAVERGRAGEGPSLIVAKVPRIEAHSSSDDAKKYQTEEMRFIENRKDPLPRFEKFLVDQKVFSLEDLEAIKQDQFQIIESAAKAADQMPFALRSSASEQVFKDLDTKYEEKSRAGSDEKEGAARESIVLVDALNHALIEEMERDSGVIVFGQDVAKGKGGVFGVTRTLTDRFGSERCFNTPLAESTIIGMAIGLSLDGIHKPVAEIQFADYAWTGMNQLFNELASIHYRSKGQWNCPVVIRMPYGGYIQGGPYHSQSTEAFLCHCPGLKVVIPSNASDAKRLLKMAIRDPNPVLFLEHKALYRQRLFCARVEPDSNELLPFGKAAVVRSGTDVTVAAWGMVVFIAMEAAEVLNQENISVEVIDLRTLVPLDFETILCSIKNTGRFLIAHEAPRNCGFGAELAARAAEEAFSFLDAPISRVAGKNCPVPYCKDLEEEVLPQAKDLIEALRALASY